MSVALVSGLAAVAVGVLVVSTATAVRILRVPEPSKDRETGAELVKVQARLAEVEMQIKSLPSLWETERVRVQELKDEATKQHRKAAALFRAVERAEEGDDDSDEESRAADEFLREHAQERPGEGVHAMRSHLESDTQEDLTRRAMAVGWTPFL